MLLVLSIKYSLEGQLISKLDWRAIDSPENDLFAFLLFTANKSNSPVRFCFSVLSYL